MQFDIAEALGDQKHRREALVILNQPIPNRRKLYSIWDRFVYRLCADGGANQLFEARMPIPDKLLPDIIHGDLDSLDLGVRTYYENKGVKVSKDPDQYSTDFGKAMRLLLDQRVAGQLTDVLILGSISGRVDQGLGLLHEMYREFTRHPEIRLWLYSERNLSFVLPSTTNYINLSNSWGLITGTIGILPIFGPATITTIGLEWDVENWETSMGGQVSTSNHIIAPTLVSVKTSTPVLFTMELKVSKEDANGTA
ncbi:thiamine pyrophosphokinase-like protein 1 [Rhizodiscina lignyota]|uniref:Thiamine pyrophosphokinase n=1 Tax=Rhizodiscina lignyota TaxID=1504668 RepID=A0A9P4M0S6_9PEZI|nr:thiamine pyrophosphokinase-like protein 1 [Rhizodiscina lignyota]